MLPYSSKFSDSAEFLLSATSIVPTASTSINTLILLWCILLTAATDAHATYRLPNITKREMTQSRVR